MSCIECRDVGLKDLKTQELQGSLRGSARERMPASNLNPKPYTQGDSYSAFANHRKQLLGFSCEDQEPIFMYPNSISDPLKVSLMV